MYKRQEYARFERTLEEVQSLRLARVDAEAQVAALEAVNAQLGVRLDDELSERTKLDGKLEQLRTSVELLKNTDVSGIETGVASVANAVAAMKPTNIDPVLERLEELGRHVSALENTDLSGVDRNISGVAASVARVETKVDELRPADLAPVNQRLEALRTTVSGLRNADLTPIESRLGALETSIAGLKNTDLAPVEKRLDRIEKRLAKAPAKPPVEREAKPDPGALLKSASFGKPDDLKRISGVGPKLEKMLNGIGVYYFFQVEAWNKADVRRVDDLLDVFKGRIERDEWVAQAHRLARQPGAAKLR